MNLEDLARLLMEARNDPWLFFKSNNLKELRIAAHPDKWNGHAERATQLINGFQQAYDRSKKPEVIITSPKYEYRLLEEIAIGDLRAVHRVRDGWLVKVPRVVLKAANNLIAKEAEVLAQFTELAKGTDYAYYFPHLMETFVVEKQRINVTFYDRRLVTAAQVMAAYPQGVSGRHIGWMLKRLLTALGYAHNKGWCHGAVTPEHVMYCPENHAGVLTGWIHAEKPGKQIKTVPAGRKDWYPVDAKKQLTPGVDIAMAGRLMQEMMNPAETPARVRNFLRGMQLPANMRPTDAWELCDDFSELLKQVYGAPKFVEFII